MINLLLANTILCSFSTVTLQIIETKMTEEAEVLLRVLKSAISTYCFSLKTKNLFKSFTKLAEEMYE
jgi:hypothetical protein